MRKRILASIILVCSAFTATLFTHKAAHASNDYSLSTFTTAYGASVPIAYLQVEDADEDFPQLSDFPSATRIGNGSKKYNCFTYAMIFNCNIENISQNTDEELFTIEDPTNLIANNPCLIKIKFSEASAQDLVMYKVLETPSEFYPNTYNHAGIINEKGSTLESTVIISKWGVYPIYRHNLTDNPYMGTSYVTYAAQPQPIERIIGFSFYKISHNYTYSIKYTNSAMSIRPISNYHKAICSGCGAFHYESHIYVNKNNYIVCDKCGYNTNYMVNSIVSENV